MNTHSPIVLEGKARTLIGLRPGQPMPEEITTGQLAALLSGEKHGKQKREWAGNITQAIGGGSLLMREEKKTELVDSAPFQPRSFASAEWLERDRHPPPPPKPSTTITNWVHYKDAASWLSLDKQSRQRFPFAWYWIDSHGETVEPKKPGRPPDPCALSKRPDSEYEDAALIAVAELRANGNNSPLIDDVALQMSRAGAFRGAKHTTIKPRLRALWWREKRSKN